MKRMAAHGLGWAPNAAVLAPRQIVPRVPVSDLRARVSGGAAPPPRRVVHVAPHNRPISSGNHPVVGTSSGRPGIEVGAAAGFRSGRRERAAGEGFTGTRRGGCGE